MLTLTKMITEAHRQHFRELLSEYLHWGNDVLQQELGISLDVDSIIADDMAHLEKYAPPDGWLTIAYQSGELAGCACMRRNTAEVAELKRMYVRPVFRRAGTGRALTMAIVAAARQLNYEFLRLDSPRAFTAAHALYRSLGFREIPPYAESEIPPEYRYGWVFMELEC